MTFDLTVPHIDTNAYHAHMSRNIRRIVTSAPDKGKVTVTFYTETDCFNCVYREVSRARIYDTIKLGRPLDLKGAYIRDLDMADIALTHTIADIDARFAFFAGIANFAHTVFSGTADFRHAAFAGGASFVNAVFEQDAIFEYTHFGTGFVLFDDARFCCASASFRGCTLQGTMRFLKTDLGRCHVRFAGADISALFFYRNTFAHHTDLRMRSIGTLVVQDCVIEKTLRCSRYKDTPVRFDALSFIDTVNLGQIDISWQDNDVKNAIARGMWHDFETHGPSRAFTNPELASQYRMLKENFRRTGRPSDEDGALRAAMRHKTSTPQRWPLKLLGLIGGYGTRPLSIFFTALIVILGFGALYTAAMRSPAPFGRFLSSVYFSAVTFLTIGYGDIAPTTAVSAILTGLEGFFGLFLMSYFTVAVARKILR